MKITDEITEVSLLLIEELESINFFRENPFIPIDVLKNKMEIEMQKKWDSNHPHFILSDDEFVVLCKEITKIEIDKNVTELFLNGVLTTSVNANGELVYRINEDYKADEF